jgi:glucokinase
MTILACDLGGTRIKLGLVNQGSLIGYETMPAHSDQSLHSRLDPLAKAFLRICSEQHVPLAGCAGLGISFPSLVDLASGRILDEHGKYRDAPQLDLPRWAKNTFGLPLSIDNDARMACIGEWQYGAGRGCNNLVMITLGTGIGTSAIIEGVPLRGRHGQAGCLGGHFTVQCRGRTCHCGNIGCAEAEASTAFLRSIAQEIEGFDNSALAREPVLDYAAIFRLARQGDPRADQLLQRSLQVWGAVVVNLIHAYDPELVILGGGIMASAEVILPAVQSYVRAHARTPWGEVRVVASALGDRAALLGCEWLVSQQLSIPRLAPAQA